MTAARVAPLIDRAPQNLPVPIGGMRPVRLSPPRRTRRPHPDIPRLFAGVGLGCAAVGCGLLLWPAPVTVSLVGGHLNVGGMLLTAAEPRPVSQPVLFQGDASYVLAEHSDGTAEAAAVWVSSAATSTGVCRLHHVGVRLIDECAFALRTGRLTSVDVLDPALGSVWQRTYSDGGRATIGVSADGGAVPVPFPIGR